MATLLRSKSAELKLFAPQAKRVNVAGSFNSWDTKSVTAKRDSKGTWSVKMSLKPGRYEYKFLVDGSWLIDPQSPSLVTNSFGTQNSILEVK